MSHEDKDWFKRMNQLEAETDAAKTQQKRRDDPMRCNECGRYVGNQQKVWSYDPTICSESCAHKRSDGERSE